MRKNLLRTAALFLCLLLLVVAGGCASNTQAKNVILLIGDGMGFNHIAVDRVYQGVDKLNMEQLPKHAEITTYSLDNQVTDSAAAATAYATGKKTNNGMISMDPEENVLPTIAEQARDKGMKVGLVATKAITDATPAAFSSHVAARGSQDDIAKLQIEEGFNLFLGGGYMYYYDKEDLLKNAGYTLVQTPEELGSFTGDKLFGLFAMEHMEDATQTPTINDMTEKALSLLDNDQGFFLMVEGSYIDMASHDNDMDNMIAHLNAFDEAVKTAYDFAQKDGNTLVLVCADHETGGITPPEGFTKDTIDFTFFTSTKHTDANVPLFGFGPGSKAVTGVVDNTDVYKIMANAINVTK